MKNLVLTKFSDKRELRLLLRHNRVIEVKHSSIYKVGGTYYVLLQSTIELTFPSNLKITSAQLGGIQPLNAIEDYIFNWAKSEILQEVNFIQFEHKTELKDNSRMINISGTEIRRTFEYLPDVFAILNYTSDSFSDGGLYNNIDSALHRINAHLEQKVRIIDLGIESTRPNATPLLAAEEINILQEVLPPIIKLKNNKKFSLSIDTYHSETITCLLDKDVDVINNVSGNIPSELVKSIIQNGKRYVAMHSLTMPAQKDLVLDASINPTTYLYQWMENKIHGLDKLNIDLTKIILDPGIGFGLTPAQSWYVVNNLDKFEQLPCEIMLGHSRKSFFSHIGNQKPEGRDLITAVIALNNISKVDYLRLHDLTVFNQIPTLK